MTFLYAEQDSRNRQQPNTRPETPTQIEPARERGERGGWGSAAFSCLPQPQHRAEVERVLRALSDGDASVDEVESAVVDVKEEAGRRAADGSNLPGAAHNDEAAEKLAEAAACMANSPGGGALIVGVNDKTGQIIGTTTEPQWLRSRIYELTDQKLAVQVDRVATCESCAPLLQRCPRDTDETLRRVARYRLATEGAPLLAPVAVPPDTPPAWRLSPQTRTALRLRSGAASGGWALDWARERQRISSGEYAR